MKKIFIVICIAAAAAISGSCVYPSQDPITFESETVEASDDTVANARQDSLVRCQGITKRGTQCERMLWWPDTLCFQHVGQAKSIVVE